MANGKRWFVFLIEGIIAGALFWELNVTMRQRDEWAAEAKEELHSMQVEQQIINESLEMYDELCGSAPDACLTIQQEHKDSMLTLAHKL